jgi:internalin A
MDEMKENESLQKALHIIEEVRKSGSIALSLSRMGLTHIPETVFHLTNLQTLNLYDNQITIIPEAIVQLSQLRNLILGNNQITEIPDVMVRLSELRQLNLDDNRISGIPDWIAELPHFEDLSLHGNRITFLPDTVARIVNLKRLSLGRNRISAIPSFIARLSKLQMLGLGGNRINAIPDSIAPLTQLEELFFWENQIKVIPAFVSKFSQLRRLYLQRNEIASIPDSFVQLTRLQELNLEINQITAIPESITQLPALQFLALSNNLIDAIPNSIGQLSQLETLDLADNRLTFLPEQLTRLKKLRSLTLHGNPGLGIPEEILGVARTDVDEKVAYKPPQEILAYFFRAADSRPLNEAKLILVGQGAVGKTSLVKALSTGKFKKGEKTTEGIKISDWECQLDKKNTATVHIWDFGGQEMMHATHQFFLTQRSLYLLVLNRRQGGADREADYWFRLIRAFGGKNAPVIVVLNKQKSEPFDVNREGWLEKYHGNIKGFVSTDCEDKKSITQLKRKIVEELKTMESLKVRFPRDWFAIKDALSQMAVEHISFDQYRNLCQKLGESDPSSQALLGGFLHSLGIALNYGQDPRLRFNYVLKPEWVTQGIYALLHAFVRSKGVFTHSEAEKELAKKKYSSEDTHFILGLMERFDLSFSLGDRQNRVLIPELLDDQQPKDAASFKPTECLNFGYKYPVLTEGLLPRFIARTHHLGQAKTRWKSGVILEDPSSGCKALVRADAADAVVRVHIDGPQESRRELLGIIRYNFEVIHSDYEFKPEPLVYPPVAPQKALLVNELEALGRSKTTVSVVLPDSSVIDQNIAALIDPVLSTPPPLKLFLSYSHLDESSIDELRKDLKVMERNGLVRPWYDRALTAGEKWEPAILNELKVADVVVCQVSRNYLAADACMAELNAAIERSNSKDAVMVAYVLNDCRWKDEKRLKEFQLLPTDGKPLSDWIDGNKYWHAVAEGIQKAVKKFQAEKKSRPSRAGMEN